MGRLDGKVALITGAARGQGAAEARLFLEEGARVVVADIRDDMGRGLVADLGERSVYEHLDVASEDDWTSVVGRVKERFGALHVLVNNAAISRHSKIEDCELSEFDAHYRINQLGTFLGIKSSLELLVQSAPSSVVNIASTSAVRGSFGGSAYNASKFAVIGLTKCAAIELGPRGVRVNAICPGGIDTEMARTSAREWMGVEFFEQTASEDSWQLPLRRMGQPDEIARLALFLASDESSYCTGAEFVADGGLLADQPFAPGGRNGPQRPPITP